jgi:ATP-binding cassette subfamily B protein
MFGAGRGGGGGHGGRFYRYSEEEVKPKVTKAILLRIAGYFKPYWKLLVVLIALLIITSVLALLPPILVKNIIDVALADKNLSLLAILLACSFGATVAGGLLSVAQNYLNSIISKHIMFDMRNSMFRHLQRMSIRFFSNVQAGEITSRMNNDIGGIEGIFSGTVAMILQNVFVFIAAASTLFITNWKLALVAILILPLFILPTRKVGRVRWKIASETQAKLANLNTVLQETMNIAGMMLVKIFTREKFQQDKFETVNREVTKLQIRESLAGRWFFMAIGTFAALGPMFIYLVGGILLIKYNAMTVGGIVMFVSLLGQLYGPVTSFANISSDVTRSLALFERIFQYFDLQPDIADGPDAGVLGQVDGEIRFRDVNFSYKEKAETLKHIDLVINPGSMAAFVGPSGAGKTTITYLLPRLYDVVSGSVEIDGRDIRSVTLESLRANIGIVTQDTYLFNDTIRNNLLFAKPEASAEELISACRAANIHEMIAALPNGYDTVVGERGIKLSGGEKQRLSIARALLKDPRVIILDEATSSLDSVSESLIQTAIKPLLRNRTSLVIAHRLSTVMAADCIYVVDGGEIVEQGKHEELLELDGVYKKLYDKQFGNRRADKAEQEEEMDTF